MAKVISPSTAPCVRMSCWTTTHQKMSKKDALQFGQPDPLILLSCKRNSGGERGSRKNGCLPGALEEKAFQYRQLLNRFYGPGQSAARVHWTALRGLTSTGCEKKTQAGQEQDNPSRPFHLSPPSNRWPAKSVILLASCALPKPRQIPSLFGHPVP